MTLLTDAAPRLADLFLCFYNLYLYYIYITALTYFCRPCPLTLWKPPVACCSNTPTKTPSTASLLTRQARKTTTKCMSGKKQQQRTDIYACHWCLTVCLRFLHLYPTDSLSHILSSLLPSLPHLLTHSLASRPPLPPSLSADLILTGCSVVVINGFTEACSNVTCLSGPQRSSRGFWATRTG